MVALTNLVAAIVATRHRARRRGDDALVARRRDSPWRSRSPRCSACRDSRSRTRRSQEAAMNAAHERQMTTEVQRREFDTRLANALEMAEDEPEAHDAIERALRVRRTRRTDRAAARRQQPRAPRPHGRVVADGRAPGLHRRLTGALPGRAARPDAALRRQRRRSTPARSCADGNRAGAPRSACRCRSWGGRSESSTRRARPVTLLDDARSTIVETLANRSGARLGMLRVDGRDAAPGVDRRSDRPHQPPHAREPRAGAARVRRGVLARHGRPRPVQVAQRHPRSRGRRPRACASSPRPSATRWARTTSRAASEARSSRSCCPTHRHRRARSDDGEGPGETLAAAVNRGDVANFTASFGVVHSADADTFDELVVARRSSAVRRQARRARSGGLPRALDRDDHTFIHRSPRGRRRGGRRPAPRGRPRGLTAPDEGAGPAGVHRSKPTEPGAGG